MTSASVVVLFYPFFCPPHSSTPGCWRSMLFIHDYEKVGPCKEKTDCCCVLVQKNPLERRRAKVFFTLCFWELPYWNGTRQSPGKRCCTVEFPPKPKWPTACNGSLCILMLFTFKVSTTKSVRELNEQLAKESPCLWSQWVTVIY